VPGLLISREIVEPPSIPPRIGRPVGLTASSPRITTPAPPASCSWCALLAPSGLPRAPLWGGSPVCLQQRYRRGCKSFWYSPMAVTKTVSSFEELAHPLSTTLQRKPAGSASTSVLPWRRTSSGLRPAARRTAFPRCFPGDSSVRRTFQRGLSLGFWISSGLPSSRSARSLRALFGNSRRPMGPWA
jgi:hypothetical protein